MSIQWHPTWDRIKALEAQGQLRALLPRSRRETVCRPMYLVPELHGALTATYSDSKEVDRYSSLQADLEVFVTGQPVTDSYLKPLEPKNKGVWEIKSKRPRPSIRLFGLFASRDVFVGTNYQVRNYLGGFNSPEWKEASRLARHEWRKLFEMDPQIGELHELVSGAIYV